MWRLQPSWQAQGSGLDELQVACIRVSCLHTADPPRVALPVSVPYAADCSHVLLLLQTGQEV